MGNQFISPNRKEFESEYIYLQKYHSGTFGTVSLWQHKTKLKKAFSRTILLLDSEQIIELRGQVRDRMKFNHPNIANLLGYDVEEQIQYCYQINTLTLFFEYFPNTLLQEIENRNIIDYQFTESEIWSYLLQIVNGIVYLHKQRIAHAYLDPSNIMLNSNGQIKLAECGLFTNWKNLNSFAQENRDICVSPELGDIKQEFNWDFTTLESSDVFCLGLIMIRLCTGKDSQSLYETNTYQINRLRLLKAQQEIKNKYSFMLFNIIEQMTEYDSKDRISSFDLQDFLQKNEETIKQQKQSKNNQNENDIQIQNKSKTKSTQRKIKLNKLLSCSSERSQFSDLSQSLDQNIITSPFTYSTNKTISNISESANITPKTTGRIRKTVKFYQ